MKTPMVSEYEDDVLKLGHGDGRTNSILLKILNRILTMGRFYGL